MNEDLDSVSQINFATEDLRAVAGDRLATATDLCETERFMPDTAPTLYDSTSGYGAFSARVCDPSVRNSPKSLQSTTFLKSLRQTNAYKS